MKTQSFWLKSNKLSPSDMAEKEKAKVSQPPKNIPKDGQVIMAIMKEMGILEYDSKCLVQLTEFVYRYATCVLEDSRNFAYNCKKRFLDIEDVKLSLSLANENSFVQPPSREVLLECARAKNSTPLPLIKPHCGLRLPPDRYCLSANNYLLKYSQKKKALPNTISNTKIPPKQNVSYIKRTSLSPVLKQSVTIPKPFINTVSHSQAILKPKIQIQQATCTITSGSVGAPTEASEDGISGIKRKREDDDIDG